MGRSPVLTISSSIRSASVRSALSSMKPGAVRMAPGPDAEVEAISLPLCDRLVDGDELAPVREGRLHLDVRQHLGHPVHHLVAGQHLASLDHPIRHATAVAGPLDHPGGQY